MARRTTTTRPASAAASHPTRWSDDEPLRLGAAARGGAWRGLGPLIGALLLAGCDGCGKETEAALPPAPPPPGGASAEMVSTGLGMGLGLSAHLAPTSTTWDDVVVTGEQSAVITGHSMDRAIALRTDDGGRSWQALTAPAEGRVIGWGVGADNTVGLALGQRAAKKRQGVAGAMEEMSLSFAEPTDTEMGAPLRVFPEGSAPPGTTPLSDRLAPAVWSGPAASVLMSAGRGGATLAYVVPPGAKLPAKTPQLPREQFVPAPYGRPPSLLSIGAGQLRVRPWPQPTAEIDSASPLPGLRASGATADALATSPRCESGAFTFQVLSTSPKAAYLIGVSPTRALAVKLDQAEPKLLGCSTDAIVVQGTDAETKQPTLIRCALDGTCAKPQSPPFRYWTDEHERTIRATATSRGIVATMAAKAGARWGLYLGQSLDQGKLFELPRVIGEGTSDRGFIEIGALISWPKRTLLLLSADVTGTTRRGFYVIASDDQGTNWGPP